MMRSSPPAPRILQSGNGPQRREQAVPIAGDSPPDRRAQVALGLVHSHGLFERLHRLWPRRLTVLAYHRIIDSDGADFVGLAENVSATPDSFAAQVDLLRRWFQVISLEHLLAWLQGRADLPKFAALITFDDGYRDNFDHALPILQRYRLPAVIFLATNCVGSQQPFFWDLAAYCFRRTHRSDGDLPLCGLSRWASDGARERALQAWLTEVKRRPADEYGELSRALARSLEVDVPADAFARQHLSWDQVRQLMQSGVAIAAHTRNHAILGRIAPERARDEVMASKRCIEAALGTPVHAFAYPNGLGGDYRAEDIAMLRREGFLAAFTLADGPTGRRSVRRDPLIIRRILVTRNDDLASFAAKVTGFTRFVRRIKPGRGAKCGRGAMPNAHWH